LSWNLVHQNFKLGMIDFRCIPNWIAIGYCFVMKAYF
jgi:hypothetical protein